MDMQTMTTTEATVLKTKVEQVIDVAYASIDQRKKLYPVAKPDVKFGNSWGRLTVEVSIHWQLQVELLAALQAAGLDPKITNFGLVSWQA
jgi:hypothetical protein